MVFRKKKVQMQTALEAKKTVEEVLDIVKKSDVRALVNRIRDFDSIIAGLEREVAKTNERLEVLQKYHIGKFSSITKSLAKIMKNNLFE
jgi:hypothetical protein